MRARSEDARPDAAVTCRGRHALGVDGILSVGLLQLRAAQDDDDAVTVESAGLFPTYVPYGTPFSAA